MVLVSRFISCSKKSSFFKLDFFFLKNEYEVVGLDYKDGNPWELGDFLKKEFDKLTKNYKEIVVIANSIGAFYAYEYLSEFNIKHAFFISPIADMHKKKECRLQI